METVIITTERDLKIELDAWLGSEATKQIVDDVAEELMRMDHPQWGHDWGEWLDGIDVLEMAFRD